MLEIVGEGLGADTIVFVTLGVSLFLSLLAITSFVNPIVAVVFQVLANVVFLISLAVAWYTGFLYSGGAVASPIFMIMFLAQAAFWVYILFKLACCFAPWIGDLLLGRCAKSCSSSRKCVSSSSTESCPTPSSTSCSTTCSSSSSSSSECIDDGCGVNPGPFIPDTRCNDKKKKKRDCSGTAR